jgi:hypothetical protein
MCSCDSGDGPDFTAYVNRRARKPHRCCECQRTIRVGDIYQRISVGYERTVSSYSSCVACARLSHAFWLVGDGDCAPLFGELLECTRELIREDMFGEDKTATERRIVEAFMAPSRTERLAAKSITEDRPTP